MEASQPLKLCQTRVCSRSARCQFNLDNLATHFLDALLLSKPVLVRNQLGEIGVLQFPLRPNASLARNAGSDLEHSHGSWILLSRLRRRKTEVMERMKKKGWRMKYPNVPARDSFRRILKKGAKPWDQAFWKRLHKSQRDRRKLEWVKPRFLFKSLEAESQY